MRFKEALEQNSGETSETVEVIRFESKKEFLLIASCLGQIARESLGSSTSHNPLLEAMKEETAKESLNLLSKFMDLYLDPRVGDCPHEISLDKLLPETNEMTLEIGHAVLKMAVEDCTNS